MQYLTYEEYKAMGGSAPEVDFPALERRARAYVDDWTLGRVMRRYGAADDVPECVKECMFAVIGCMPGAGGGDRVSSFSNGQDSFTFDLAPDEEAPAYAEALRLLPPDLTCLAAVTL